MKFIDCIMLCILSLIQIMTDLFTVTSFPQIDSPSVQYMNQTLSSVFQDRFSWRCMCTECIDDIVGFKSAVSVRLRRQVVSNKSTRLLLRHVRMTYSTRPQVLVHLFRPAPLTPTCPPWTDQRAAARTTSYTVAQRSSTGHPK